MNNIHVEPYAPEQWEQPMDRYFERPIVDASVCGTFKTDYVSMWATAVGNINYCPTITGRKILNSKIFHDLRRPYIIGTIRSEKFTYPYVGMTFMLRDQEIVAFYPKRIVDYIKNTFNNPVMYILYNTPSFLPVYKNIEAYLVSCSGAFELESLKVMCSPIPVSEKYLMSIAKLLKPKLNDWYEASSGKHVTHFLGENEVKCLL